MADKALIVRDPVTLTRKDRTDRIKDMMERILAEDMRTVRLQKHMFKEEAELNRLGLSVKEQKAVRAWELPKKETPFGLVASHERVMARIRRDEAKQAIQLNVTNMAIQLPPKQDDDVAPVIVDVEPSK